MTLFKAKTKKGRVFCFVLSSSKGCCTVQVQGPHKDGRTNVSVCFLCVRKREIKASENHVLHDDFKF